MRDKDDPHAGRAIRPRASALVAAALCLALSASLLSPPIVGATSHARATAPSELYLGLMFPGTPGINALQANESEVGKGMSLVLWYQSWEENGALQTFPAEQMTAVRAHGSIPVLAWEPDESPQPPSEAPFSLAKISGGAWDSYIHDYAVSVKAWGHPFFLRFASEMNGSWTPWSEKSNGNSAGQFVQAWRHVHDIFTSVGASNVTWVWCPNVADNTTTPLAELYPGNAYVDWVGMDGYNYSVDLYAPWHSFAQVFHTTYDDLVRITAPGMPIMIGEMGSVEHGGSKPAWIIDALTTQLPASFPRVKGLIWFDTSDGKFNLRVDTSPQSLAAFRGAIAAKTYQPNIYSQLYQSPIPAPEDVMLTPPSTQLPFLPAVELGVVAFLLWIGLLIVRSTRKMRSRQWTAQS